MDSGHERIMNLEHTVYKKDKNTDTNSLALMLKANVGSRISHLIISFPLALMILSKTMYQCKRQFKFKRQDN